MEVVVVVVVVVEYVWGANAIGHAIHNCATVTNKQYITWREGAEEQCCKGGP